MKAFLSTMGIAIKNVEKASQNMGSFDTTDKVVSSTKFINNFCIQQTLFL